MELLTFPIFVQSEPKAVFEIRWLFVAALLSAAQNGGRRLTLGERGDDVWRGDWEEPNYGSDVHQDDPKYATFSRRSFTSVDAVVDVIYRLSSPGDGVIPIVFDGEVVHFGYSIIEREDGKNCLTIDLPGNNSISKERLLKHLCDFRERLYCFGEECVEYKTQKEPNRLAAWVTSIFPNEPAVA